jgi:hypothetical protein
MSTDTSSEKIPASGPDAKIENEPGSEDSIKFFATAEKINPQAAAMARFRYGQPESLAEAAVAIGVLYGIFVGIPLAALIWSAWKIWHGGY